MDALLVDRWPGDLERLTIFDQASLSEARERARAAAAAAGLSTEIAGAVAIVASELASNHLRHAREGLIAVRTMRRAGVPGVEIVAADRGPGIGSPTAAIERGASTAGGLGVGLAAVLRLADEVDVDVRLGEGTCIRARKFQSLQRRREVGVIGRPIDGERVSGDDVAFTRTDDELLVAVADGLGHGAEARAAAAMAVEAALAARARGLDTILGEAGEALEHTRGAAMSLVRVDERDETLGHAGVGNVTTHVVGPSVDRAFSGRAAVLGVRPRGGQRAPGRGHGETSMHLGQWDVVVVFTDGLTSRARLDGRETAERRRPSLIADTLLSRFGRSHDDATVVVIA